MAIGPGKYDDLATECMLKTKAIAVVLIVFDGNRGSGISAKEITFDIAAAQIPKKLPGILREIAAQVERDTQLM